MANNRVLVVGGGVIGLSIAWELNRRGFQTVVADINPFGRKASWAGAGILAPAKFETMTQPLDRLKAYGSQLHRVWSHALRQVTGIDNGYSECGGLYLARTVGERAALLGLLDEWSQYQIDFEHLEPNSLPTAIGPKPMLAVSVPCEGQIDNRMHLSALVEACSRSGSVLIPCCGAMQFKFLDSRCEAAIVENINEEIVFDHLCVAVGAWSTELVQQFGISLPVIPVRGQMLLYKLKQKSFAHILNEGSRYLVPRSDGHIVVGSTTEEVGFDEMTTESAMSDLTNFACQWVPGLNDDCLVSSWAGLRPASHDGFPFMGRLSEFENVWIATGHFKSGLQMAPAVAEIMSDMLQGNSPKMNTSAFDSSRLNVEA